VRQVTPHLLVANVVMKYQMSLLNWEETVLNDDLDLHQRMEKDCEIDLAKHGQSMKLNEDLEQMIRVKEGLQLDIDIMKQLIVNMQAKIKQKQDVG